MPSPYKLDLSYVILCKKGDYLNFSWELPTEVTHTGIACTNIEIPVCSGWFVDNLVELGDDAVGVEKIVPLCQLHQALLLLWRILVA